PGYAGDQCHSSGPWSSGPAHGRHHEREDLPHLNSSWSWLPPGVDAVTTTPPTVPGIAHAPTEAWSGVVNTATHPARRQRRTEEACSPLQQGRNYRRRTRQARKKTRRVPAISHCPSP